MACGASLLALRRGAESSPLVSMCLGGAGLLYSARCAVQLVTDHTTFGQWLFFRNKIDPRELAKLTGVTSIVELYSWNKLKSRDLLMYLTLVSDEVVNGELSAILDLEQFVTSSPQSIRRFCASKFPNGLDLQNCYKHYQNLKLSYANYFKTGLNFAGRLEVYSIFDREPTLLHFCRSDVSELSAIHSNLEAIDTHPDHFNADALLELQGQLKELELFLNDRNILLDGQRG